MPCDMTDAFAGLAGEGATSHTSLSRSGCSWLSESAIMPRPDSSVVERGPEKAGVGGSIPSLATTLDSYTCGRFQETARELQEGSATLQL